MTCDECRDNLFALVEDVPGEPRMRERLRQHVAGCADCAARAEALVAQHKRLLDLPAGESAVLADAVMDALRAREPVRFGQSAFQTSDSLVQPGRPVMKPRKGAIRIGLVIAAGIAAAFLYFVAPHFVPRGTGGAGVAFAAVIQHLEVAHTLSFAVTATDSPKGHTQSGTYEVLDGRHVRVTLPDGRVAIIDGVAGKGLLLNPEDRTAYPLEAQRSEFNMYAMLSTLRNGQAVDLGRDKVDGLETLVFRTSSKELGDVKVWVDPATNLPVRIESIVAAAVPTPGFVVTDIAFDQPMDADRFSLAPPAGYALKPANAAGAITRTSTMVDMRNIVMAITLYRDGHDDAWPPDLLALEPYGITREKLRNAMCPELDIGYSYLRPGDGFDPGRLLLIECDATWRSGICVGFEDGHIEFLSDEARYQRELATAREKAAAE